MCSRDSPVMDDIYRGLSRKHSDGHFTASILSAETVAPHRRSGLALPTKTEEHECHSPGALRTISIRYVRDYVRSCSCSQQPVAQPSSSSITASWPHGGAVCSYSKSVRLCNLMMANCEWPY